MRALVLMQEQISGQSSRWRGVAKPDFTNQDDVNQAHQKQRGSKSTARGNTGTGMRERRPVMADRRIAGQRRIFAGRKVAE